MKNNLQSVIKIILTIFLSILAIDAVATMVFGSLGNTSESAEWNYILILYVFLAVLGASVTVYRFTKIQFIITILLPILSLALLGFYYGGSLTNNNSQIAIITALISGTIGVFISIKKNKIILEIITPVATIAAYGFAFYAGTNAIALFTVSRLFSAILWSIACLIYINLTVTNFFLR